MKVLRRMHREWPFFRALLSNMDMVLAKTDLALAKRYAELSADRERAAAIFGTLEAEWTRTVAALNDITGTSAASCRQPGPRRLAAASVPYIAPLNHLQVELLRRWRTGSQDERTRRGILISINGIAAGLRNTG